MPVEAEILDVVDENSAIKTYVLKPREPIHFQPGHFVMAGMPGVGESPFGVSSSCFEDDTLAISVQIQPRGKNTTALHNAKRGETALIRGPFGNSYPMDYYKGREVYVVGGGVGMAPLVFFGQALKFYSFQLKAFIGIDRIETLLYSAPFAPTFAEDQQNAYVYIETLSGIGLRPQDMRLSCEILNGTERKNGRLPDENYHEGFVTEQYESYLEGLSKTNNILVIACGPQPMLQALSRITSRFNLPMKVLLEKRMACGIGVCLSCVCLTKKNGSKQYSRVCTDGPLVDPEDIDWG